jgi:GNAT superfamily N-acetyltransferase
MTTRSSARGLPSLDLRTFSHTTATPQEWLALHDYMRAPAEEENPGDSVIGDEMRERETQIDWPLFEVHPCPRTHRRPNRRIGGDVDAATWYSRLRAQMDAHGGDHAMALLSAGEKIVAVSEASLFPKLPDRACQNLTAVAPAWRGRGLAKAVKARLLRAVRERQPSVRWIITTHANCSHSGHKHTIGVPRHREVGIYQIALGVPETAVLSRL